MTSSAAARRQVARPAVPQRQSPGRPGWPAGWARAPHAGSPRRTRRARKKRGKSERRSSAKPTPSVRCSCGLEQLRIGRGGGSREGRGLGRQPVEVEPLDLGAHRPVAAPAERARELVVELERLAVEGIELPCGHLEPRALDRRPPVRVGLVGLRHGRLAKAQPLAAHLDRQLGLAAGQLGVERPGGQPQVALDREIEQHAPSPCSSPAGGDPAAARAGARPRRARTARRGARRSARSHSRP